MMLLKLRLLQLLCPLSLLCSGEAPAFARPASYYGQASDEEVRTCTQVTVETSKTLYRIGEEVPLFVTLHYSCPLPKLTIYPGGHGYEHFRVMMSPLDEASTVTAVGPEAHYREQERNGHSIFENNLFGSRDNFTYMPEGMTREEAKKSILETIAAWDAVTTTKITNLWFPTEPADVIETTTQRTVDFYEDNLTKCRYFSGGRTETLSLSENYRVDTPGRYRVVVRVHISDPPIDSNPIVLEFR